MRLDTLLPVPDHRFQSLLTLLFFRQALNRRTAARTIGVSESGLNRQFPKAFAGLTFQQAKKVFPLVTAARQLTRKARVTDVALGLQYCDSTSCGRIFRKAWGMSPLDFQRRFESMPEETIIAVEVLHRTAARLKVLFSIEDIEGVLVSPGVIVIAVDN